MQAALFQLGDVVNDDVKTLYLVTLVVGQVMGQRVAQALPVGTRYLALEGLRLAAQRGLDERAVGLEQGLAQQVAHIAPG